MDWSTVVGVGSPIAALVVGGLFGRRKTKADTHAVVVADAVTVLQKANERADKLDTKLENATRRIDDLELRENQRDELARQHLRWDWRQLRRLIDQGM